MTGHEPITIVEHNGSKFYGEAPDPIEALLDVLAREPLRRTFENYGNFAMPERDGYVRFWGNFFAVSHCFSIYTNDPDVIDRLTKAIRENQQRVDYKAQGGGR
jgi:hypothetical protein